MQISRRSALSLASNGFGWLAASSLLHGEESRRLHHPAKAKRVVMCFMPGGVSHMDSFDPKPKLTELDGKPAKLDNYVAGPNRKWLGSPWKFRQHGLCGASVSELFPNIARHADKLAIIRSMQSGFPLHARGNVLLHTGRNIGGFPSLGSWITYGLGTENRDLPGYVLLRDSYVPPGGVENFSNGFLPASHQATHIRDEGEPVDHIRPADADHRLQRAKLDALLAQDRAFVGRLGRDDAVESAIANYEMAYRMQSLIPDVLDLGKEPPSAHKLYGLDSSDRYKRLYGLQCLRARRLLESGVRFVEVTSPNLVGQNGSWDQHSELRRDHARNAFVTDQAVAALLEDLQARGMLDETLVIWAGEFGRTPDTGNGDGRDHHPFCFTVWLAGGGIRGGMTHGETDELGDRVARDPVTMPDFHATILHVLGLDHERLTYRFGGREQRLTDVHGNPIKTVLA
jgi:hypothetical protein